MHREEALMAASDNNICLISLSSLFTGFGSEKHVLECYLSKLIGFRIQTYFSANSVPLV